jgi:hypothetical protein
MWLKMSKNKNTVNGRIDITFSTGTQTIGIENYMFNPKKQLSIKRIKQILELHKPKNLKIKRIWTVKEFHDKIRRDGQVIPDYIAKTMNINSVINELIDEEKMVLVREELDGNRQMAKYALIETRNFKTETYTSIIK